MLLAIHPKNPEPRKIQQIIDLLNDGAVIVCPTDTVYAFVCSAEQSRAIEEVAKLNTIARKHGGTPDIFPAQDHGFMVSHAFTDPDGHIWEAMWMVWALRLKRIF